VFRWLIGFAEENQLAVAAAMCADKHFATALVALEEARCDFTNPIAARALARWRSTGVECGLPKNGLSGESLLAWHLAQLVGWEIPVRNPRLAAMGSYFGLHRGPPPELLLVSGWLRSAAEWVHPGGLFGRQQSVLLVETVTGVVCGGFADSAWVLDGVPADDMMSSTYFVLEHRSGETRKCIRRGRRRATRQWGRTRAHGSGTADYRPVGMIATLAGERLSDEDAVMIHGGGTDARRGRR
jgi:hypothetical protein